MHPPKVYLELVRPFTLIAPAIGIIAGASVASQTMPGMPVLIGALSAALLNAASNVTNQYFDIEIDRINKPFRPLPSGRMAKARVPAFAGLLYLGALLLAGTVNPRFFALALLTAGITFFYSAPPFRFKKIFLINNGVIALARGMLLIVAGWGIVRPVFSPAPWFIGLIFALYLAGAATTKDFSDIPGDARFGIKTLPVVFGPEQAARLISPFFYFPFVLIPLGIISGILRTATLPLTLLFFWGFYTAHLLTRRPQDLTLEKNHISWKHMYLILIAGQIGFAIAYLIKT